MRFAVTHSPDRLARLTRLLGACAAVLLAGCGGGSMAGRSDPQGLAADTVARAHALDVSNQPVWTDCAVEGQYCAFSGVRDVRYGTPTAYVTRSLANGTACTNQVFGDPAYGIVKGCTTASGTVDDSSVAWTLCATEGQTCTVPGTRRVRYGTVLNNVVGSFTGQVACSNAVFGDPAYGIVKSCWYEAGSNPAPVAVPTDPGPSGQNPPTVLNATASGRPGDVVTLQGDNFGASPRVYLDGSPGSLLEIVNRVGTGWLAVQIPAGAQGALILRVANATGVSAQVKLNAARPLHLDTLQLAPAGAFRVFGRNLLLAGSTPTVKVNGLAAAIDLSKSDEHLLTAVAPAGLAATSAAVISVDNGNGSGAATLDRTVAVVASGAGDPFQLGVGWAAAFTAFSANVIDAARDPRLPVKVACDGNRDDTPAIQQAIQIVATAGGGVVQLPAGRCRLAGGMNLQSRVVVQGAGTAATELVYASNYPVFGVGLDLAGVRNLTLTNSGASTEGPLLKSSTRVFLANLRVNLGTSRQMYLTGNRQVVISGSTFVQTGSMSDQGPYLLNDSAGLVFEGNTTQWVNGAPAFVGVHDSYLHASRFTRDGRFQHAGGTVHSMTLDFAHRVAVVGNLFDVANGPISTTSRNDGETILTEGGGGQRTENLGTVASATPTTLSDPSNSINVDPFSTGSIPENYGVAIVGGKGAGQTRRVTAYAAPTLTVDRAWDVTPDATSRYATFVWGLEKSLIKGNTLSQNPRGIWLYHTAVREVEVVDNGISQGGGIYLRSYQNLSTRSFMPIYNVLIARNTVVNTTGQWMSYINSVFVNADAKAFGIATLGIEVRANAVTANRPNLSSQTEEYAGTEGVMNMMRVESSNGYESSAEPRLLGSILANNTCTNCDVAVRIGTGAGGTTILNTTLVNSARPLDDWATASTPEKSTSTVSR